MATNSLIFDTYKAVSSLRERGLSKEAAEGITDLLKDVTENNLVTKTDLREEIRNLELRLYKHLAGILIAHGLGTAALTVALLQLLNSGA